MTAAAVARIGLLALAGVLGLSVLAASGAVQAHAQPGATGQGAVAYWRSEIWVADLDGLGGVEITHGPGTAGDGFPVWSPDGSRLAFVRLGVGVTSRDSLYVVNRDGTGLRSLAHVRSATGGRSGPSWSPDGRRLAYGDGPLYLVNVDGTGTRRLVASSTCRPAWAPDGKSLLYVADPAACGSRGSNRAAYGYRSLYRIDVDGSHRRRLAVGSLGGATWSPDGTQIAYMADCRVIHGGEFFCSASLMRADGSGIRRIARNTYGEWVEWVAGGKGLLWFNDTGLASITNVTTGHTRRLRAADLTAVVGVSSNGQKVAVAKTVLVGDGYVERLSVLAVDDGHTVRRITVPTGWQFDSVSDSVYLP